MKKITKIMSAVVLAAASLSLSGCQEEDFGFNAKDIAYKKAFQDVFGKVDSGHTWSTAANRQISVNVNGTSDIYVYTTDGKHLLAHYHNISGLQEISFDADYQISKVMVTDGRMAYDVKFGENVTFGNATRAGHYETSNGVEVSRSSDSFMFTKAEATDWKAVLPESNDNTKKKSQTNLAKDNVTKNFMFKSTGPFTIYPVYWQTSQSDELGLFYYDTDGKIVKVRIYTAKSGLELAAIDHIATGEESWYLTNETLQAGDYAWIGAYSTPSSDHFSDSKQYMRSTGITVSIPSGTVFGMYLKNPNGNDYFYSDCSLNEHYTESSREFDETPCYASTFTYNGHTYLGFEDWKNGDFDLNDLMVRFDGSDPTTNNIPQVIDLDATTSSYWFAYEDLGGTFDLDFNDVVLKVDHLAGETEAVVSLMAAGGTLDVSVKYDGTENVTTAAYGNTSSNVLFSEVHAAFASANSKTIATTDPINVNAGTSCSINPTATITVPSNYSVVKNRSKFVIDVTNDSKNYQVNVPYEEGAVPQGICIKATNWQWPDELQPIGVENKYSEGEPKYPDFPDWVENHLSTTWYGEVWDGSSDQSAEVIESPDVTASASKTILSVGETLDITITSNTVPTLTIESSNTEVLTIISNGNGSYTVTAIKPGTANINITAPASEYYSAINEKLSFTVEKLTPELTIIAPEEGGSIELNTTDTKSYTIEASATEGSGAISFSQGNTLVVTIDESTGEITVVGPGETTLGVTISGNDSYKSVTKYVRVNVTDSRQDATITIMNGSDEVSANSTLELPLYNGTATITGTATSNEVVTFNSQYENVATIVDGLITAKSVGTTTITASVRSNDTYKSAELKFTVSVSDNRAESGLAIMSAVSLSNSETSTEGSILTSNGNNISGITFSSADQNVATVDEDGKITAIGIGSTTINVSFEGNETYKPFNGTCTVSSTYIDGTSISISNCEGNSCVMSIEDIFNVNSTGTIIITVITNDTGAPSFADNLYGAESATGNDWNGIGTKTASGSLVSGESGYVVYSVNATDIKLKQDTNKPYLVASNWNQSRVTAIYIK